jgi:hypothetical protein
MAETAAAVFLLLVTWFGSGGVSSYQVEFADRALCERAIDGLAAEQSRLQDDFPTAEPAGTSAVQVQTGGIIDPSRPFVAAVCVQQR